jgi:preprotein translocase subunit YajC
MDFISSAYALGTTGTGTGASGSSGNTFISFIPIIAMVVIFYFLLIRPQQKRAKEHRDMVTALKSGDRIITSGGIHGEVTGLDDKSVTIEIAPKVRIKVTRDSISVVLK